MLFCVLLFFFTDLGVGIRVGFGVFVGFWCLAGLGVGIGVDVDVGEISSGLLTVSPLSV